MSRPTTTSSSPPPPTTNPRSPHLSSIPPFPQLSPPTPVITPWIPYLIPFTFSIKTTAATEESPWIPSSLSPSSDGLSTKVVVGNSIGGVSFPAIVIVVCIICKKKRKSDDKVFTMLSLSHPPGPKAGGLYDGHQQNGGHKTQYRRQIMFRRHHHHVSIHLHHRLS
ncbi:unnamed protein product [Brassica oleracea]|uniref:Uncharacterized protein n=1 Tax=Brassica oleracea TaxID=3712 RepID=A0A3P6E274_BRAOL|nr:unnamed protein product [Brassica oleracea]